jgi:hypothetical protein
MYGGPEAVFGENLLALGRRTACLIDKLLRPVIKALYYRRFYKQPLTLLKNWIFSGLIF